MASEDPPDTSGPNAEALTTYHVGRAVDGDSQSTDWLVERLSPLLVAQVSYRLGPTLRGVYDAEDLVQEAWMITLPRLGDLIAREGRLTPVLLRFLSRTLRHTVRNLMRKHARDAGVDAPENPIAADSGVVTRASRRELHDLVHQRLAALEPIDREVLIVRGIEQLSNKTAASLLGLGPTALAMRYRRALDRLRAALPGSVFDELDAD